MWNTVSTQFIGLLSGLALAYFTGAWRKFGHRMERYYDLAAKMPKDSPARKKFEDAANKQAEQAAGWTLDVPLPVRLVVYLLSLIFALIGASYMLSHLALDYVFFARGLRKMNADLLRANYAPKYVSGLDLGLYLMFLGSVLALVVLAFYGIHLLYGRFVAPRLPPAITGVIRNSRVAAAELLASFKAVQRRRNKAAPPTEEGSPAPAGDRED